MVEFLLRLFCIVPIHLLLTRIGYNFTNINVAAFITDCGALAIHILILLLPGKTYLEFIYTFFIAVFIAAAEMDCIPVLESMYSQGFITYVLACQFLMCYLQIDKRMNKILITLSPIFWAIFASPCCILHYFCFIVAFCFFIAGYVLGINEHLTQSLRELKDLVSRKGFIKAIQHLYTNTQIEWILKVFWFILFFRTIYTYFNEYDVWVVYVVAASNSMLQYLVFSMLLLDASCIILWCVQAILKWSVTHTVDEIEINFLMERRKVKDIVLPLFLLSCISAVCVLYFHDMKTYEYNIYSLAAIVLFKISCIGNLLFALLLCNETLRTLSISWGTVWAHIRAIVLTVSLLLLFIIVSWTFRLKWFTTKMVELAFHFSCMVSILMHTLKMLIVYILYVIDFLLPNGIEQVEEKVYKFKFIADIFAIISTICLFAIVLGQSIIEMHFNIGIGLCTLIVLFISWATFGEIYYFSLRRRFDGFGLELIKLPDATKEQLEIHKDQDGRCSICTKFMSSAKITLCGHFFHPSCLRRLIKHGATTCPECRTSLTGNNIVVDLILRIFQLFQTLLDREIKRTSTGKPRYEKDQYTLFKDKFLDSRRKLRKDIYHKLKSFSWLCGAYGLTAANKTINRPHLFLTVKRGVKHSEVFRQLQESFSCDDPEEHFELLKEPKKKPNFKRVADRCEDGSSVGSKPSTSDEPIKAVPGGRVLVCGDREWNPMRSEEDGVQSMCKGTLTMFCCKDEQHYALICSHVGCITTDASHAQAAFKQEECIREIRGSLSYYEENAQKRKYYFENGSEENNDESKRELLGVFDNNHFDDECDILSVKISNGIKINCQVVDVPPPDWVDIWNELYERVIETPHVADPVKVVKISLSSTCHEGQIVATEFSYEDKEGELFHDTTVVKGDSGSFLHDGDSGALVCFFDKKKEKKVFAYGVFEVDQLSLPEGSTSNGPYAICLNLETSLEKLGFGEAGCFNVCSGDRKPSSVCNTGDEESASNSSRCDIL